MMGDKIQAIRGMNDLLPHETPAWRQLESIFAACMNQYGYQEIRSPILENTQLFNRTIGEVTDIVEKEMYTFNDLNGESITLRPEGTAGCLRACLEHGLLHNQQQKLWYIGPMFRHEKPQKGRYRQFHHFGVEVLGIPGTIIELELMALCQRIWKTLKIEQFVHLQINTLGEQKERQLYRSHLIAYLNDRYDQLDEDSKRRLNRNPLRILDSKNPKMQSLLQEAPQLFEFLGPESKNRFTELCEGLKLLGISYTINPLLVRGLDYYGQLVFEWVTDKLGSQATVCAGGRYDVLVEQLGGNPTPAIGFGLGIERLLLILETLGLSFQLTKAPSVYLIASGKEALEHSLLLAENLRDSNSSWQIILNPVESGFKSQFKKADKSGAEYVLIVGEEEIKTNTVSVKNLRKQEEQITLSKPELIQYLQNALSKA